MWFGAGRGGPGQNARRPRARFWRMRRITAEERPKSEETRRPAALSAVALSVAPGVLMEQVLVVVIDLDDFQEVQGVLVAVAGLQIVQGGQLAADDQRQGPGHVGVFRKG